MHVKLFLIRKHLEGLWTRLVGTMLVAVFFFPSLALAHGDDDVTAATFVGPMLAFVTIVTVVGLGRLLLRAVVKRG
jgi:hypothetical protein